MLLHTITYHNAYPYPLWILLITVLLLPVMTLKIRSTKPKTKVRKIVRYWESFPDCYNKKKGAIQLHEEPVETVNLGTEEDIKEVKVGANLESNIG